MKATNNLTFSIFVAATLFTLCACTEIKDAAPTKLRVAVLPDQSAELLHQQHDQLVSYLGKSLNIDTELIIPANYSELLSLFKEKKVELAYFGGLTFVQAMRHAKAKPVAMRDIDLRFTSTFVASSKAKENTLENFKGRKLSFGSKLSTSGHLMPRFYLEERGLIPEQLFSEISYSGAHDKTMERVKSGESDLGAVNTYIYDALIAKKQFRREDFKVVWITPPFPDYTWAVHEGLNEAFKSKLLKAFLTLDIRNPEHAQILQRQSAGGFLPVNVSDFDKLAAIVQQLGLYGD